MTWSKAPHARRHRLPILPLWLDRASSRNHAAVRQRQVPFYYGLTRIVLDLPSMFAVVILPDESLILCHLKRPDGEMAD